MSVGRTGGIIAAIAFIGGFVTPTAAHAEGGIVGGFSGIIGSESSRWTDNNYDNVSGYAQFYDCSPSGYSYRLQVYRDILGVDPRIASGATCNGRVTVGDPAAGRYYVFYSQGAPRISATLNRRY